MADPTHGPYGSSLRDDFDRADLGGQWVGGVIGGYAAPTLTGNQIQVTSSSKSMRWSSPGASASSEIWCWHDRVLMGVSPWVTRDLSLYLRCDAAGLNYYRFKMFLNGDLSGRAIIYRAIDGVETALTADFPFVSLTTAFSAIGERLEAWAWDGSEWSLIQTVYDPELVDAGYLALSTQAVGGGNPVYLYVDDFGGDDVVPGNTLPPTIIGDAIEDEVLTVDEGTWSASPTSYAYQWYRCDDGGANCSAIPTATDPEYVPQDDDVGSTLRVIVSAANAYGSGVATSEATGVIAASTAMRVALASYRCRVAWDTYQLGLLSFDYSLFDGTDVFAPHPFAATFLGTYDDLSDMLREAAVEIGRDNNLETLLASTARVTLRDPTGILSAENADGPLYDDGELTERLHPIRLEGVFGETTFPIFSGWVRGVDWQPSGRKGYAELDCVDLFYWLNRTDPVISATGPTTTGAAIGLILDAIGWTDSSLRDLDTGDSIPDFLADGSKSALTLIEELLEAERGTFYIAADGTATYRDRHWRQKMDSVALIEDEMSFVSPGVDYDAPITRVRVTRTQTAYTAEATAVESDQQRLGWNDLPEISTPYLLADAAADSLADWLIWVLSRPRPPMHELQIDNRSAYFMYQMLARSFGERITVQSAQTGITEDFHIEAIRHSIGGRPRHTCSYLVSRVIPKAIQFDVSEFVAGDATAGDVFVY